ncbi:hypothetical protein QFC24_002412 [Naganishia onofrii]|uniref:Uncharacterized protein n=1 Tax=Naganishia onofrii TaxID=1851511 RepID=A0ACC2XRN9_9TREE|nr:hypothetical protein QFC24_002412 [Naganishia onofrii]
MVVTVARLKQYGTVHEDIALQEGTIANIVWTGCLLRTVLLDLFPSLADKAGNEDWHVVFESSQDCGEDEGGIFGGSIPGGIAIDPSVPVLLAWQQNQQDLTLDHGAPLRVVVPGTIGARSIKWLRKVTISSKPSQHHAQQQDYKSIPYPSELPLPSDDEKARLLANAEPMGWSPLQSVVVEAKREAEKVVIKGYGLGEKGTFSFPSAAAGIPLAQIAVTFLRLSSGTDYEPTMDEHFTERAASSAAKWHKTVLDPAGDGKRWGWTLWHVELEMEAVRQLIAAEGQEGKEGQIVVVVKAIDARGQEQTRWPEWNLRGVGFNGWSVKLVEE